MRLPAPAIIPKPVRLVACREPFTLRNDTPIRFDADSVAARHAAEELRDWVCRQTGVCLPAVTGLSPACQVPGIDLVRSDEGEGAMHPEGYRLDAGPNEVRIEARELAGFVHAAQTLRQLLPLEPEADGLSWPVPGVSVADWPRFGWRGMMLDTARHFVPVAAIKRFLDALVLHKFNVFHWHLTDDQGWRLEIRRYPRLTSVGAWRRETVVGPARESTMFDGRPHFGFYTQEDAREVVAYAAARHVTVVPEIEMPGHAQAALAAYPELSCTGGPFQVSTTFGRSKEAFCAGNDRTLEVMTGILEEVMDLFPSPHVHIGGDQCPKDRWRRCPACQARIVEKGLKDEDDLQSWFLRSINAVLQRRGRRLIGWDEIVEGGLPPGAVVAAWRGERRGASAARAGHEVVMAWKKRLYFDYYQSSDTAREPLAFGGCLPLEAVYGYEPVPEGLSEKEARHILGAQGQLWSEYLSTWSHVEYMAFPRATALAEVLWTPAAQRDWPDFRARLTSHLSRLDHLGINYRPPA